MWTKKKTRLKTSIKTYYEMLRGGMPMNIALVCTVAVNGGGLSAASKSTRRDRTAHDGIAAAMANLGFLDSCSSDLMLNNKKTD
ncbi:hypothetical protein Y032_0122g1081 [Ancylostoma ceylanicum]|nr:hypothetical protein Y032_0122g1081 [Ancylostoma ceylanicum]